MKKLVALLIVLAVMGLASTAHAIYDPDSSVLIGGGTTWLNPIVFPVFPH